MKIDIEQGTPEWHAWRADGIGGSDAATCIGENPYKTPYKLWCERTGRVRGDLSNDAMERGSYYESEAREAFTAHTGLQAEPCCYQHDDYPWIRVSLDGLTPDLTVVEIKIPMPHNFDRIEKTGEYNPAWSIQSVYNMLGAGANASMLYIYSPEGKRGLVFNIPYDPKLAKKLIASTKRMREHIIEDIGPELLDEDLEYKPFFEEARYVQLCEFEEQIKREKDEIRQNAIALASGHNYRSSMLSVKKQITERCDYKALSEFLDPDMKHKDAFVSHSESWVIRKLNRSKK